MRYDKRVDNKESERQDELQNNIIKRVQTSKRKSSGRNKNTSRNKLKHIKQYFI